MVTTSAPSSVDTFLLPYSFRSGDIILKVVETALALHLRVKRLKRNADRLVRVSVDSGRDRVLRLPSVNSVSH